MAPSARQTSHLISGRLLEHVKDLKEPAAPRTLDQRPTWGFLIRVVRGSAPGRHHVAVPRAQDSKGVPPWVPTDGIPMGPILIFLMFSLQLRYREASPGLRHSQTGSRTSLELDGGLEHAYRRRRGIVHIGRFMRTNFVLRMSLSVTTTHVCRLVDSPMEQVVYENNIPTHSSS